MEQQITEQEIRKELDAARKKAAQDNDLDARMDICYADVLLAENNLRENRGLWEISGLTRELISQATYLEGYDHLLNSLYDTCSRMADCLKEHPRLMVQLLKLERQILHRIECQTDHELGLTEDIGREISDLEYNIYVADRGEFGLLKADGRLLKSDPVEWTAKWEEIIDEVDKAAEKTLEEAPRGMGFCFGYWAARKSELLKHGIDWRSPSAMNPGVLFD